MDYNSLRQQTHNRKHKYQEFNRFNDKFLEFYYNKISIVRNTFLAFFERFASFMIYLTI